MKFITLNKIFLLVAALFLAKISAAQSPDNSFGTNGRVYTGFGHFSSYLQSMVLLPDGKIVSAGENTNSTLAILVAKHNADGSPDMTFNGSGKKQVDFGSAYEYCYSIFAQSDGKLLLAGSSNGNAALARLLPDGNYDTDFGSGGRLTVSFGAGNGSAFQKVLLQTGGKILAIGEAYNTSSFDFAAVQFNSDGSIDASYGNQGKVLVNFNGFNDFGRDAVWQPDGKLIIAGAAKNSNGNSSIALCRLNMDGSIDNSFGTNGKTTLSISGEADDYAERVILLPDNKIITGGYSAGNFQISRFADNGEIDNSFGSNGYVITDFDDFQDKAYAMVTDAAGSIYLGGHGYEAGNGGLFHFAIAKYHNNGTLNTDFDGDGKMTVLMGPYSSTIFDMVIQPDGKLLMGGQSTNLQGAYTDFALLRLENISVGMIENSLPSHNIMISPNPVHESLTICNLAGGDNRQYIIFNVTGGIVKSGNLSAEKSINVADLKTGYYVIKIQNSGNQTYQRFLKL